MSPTRNPLLCLLGASLLSTLSPSVFAQSLRDSLSPEEFRRAGLEKLSAQELEVLSTLVQTRATPQVQASPSAEAAVASDGAPASPQVAPALPQGEAAFGRETKVVEVIRKAQNVPDKMTGRINGPFNGWSGNTEFHLTNGQVWRQAEPDQFVISLDSPEVTIRKGFLGTYFLNVEGYNSRVKVKRVK